MRLLTAVVAFICATLLGAGAGLAQTTFTPRDETPEEFATGAGRDEAFYACTACHNFKLVAAQGLSRAGWEESINLMIRRHNMPPLDGKDREVALEQISKQPIRRAPRRAGADGRTRFPNNRA